jgi:hypothetical protein
MGNLQQHYACTSQLLGGDEKPERPEEQRDEILLRQSALNFARNFGKGQKRDQ